jgi:hypothetical protein
MVDDLTYDEMQRHLSRAMRALAEGDIPELRAEMAHADRAAAAWEDQRRDASKREQPI